MGDCGLGKMGWERMFLHSMGSTVLCESMNTLSCDCHCTVLFGMCSYQQCGLARQIEKWPAAEGCSCNEAWHPLIRGRGESRDGCSRAMVGVQCWARIRGGFQLVIDKGEGLRLGLTGIASGQVKASCVYWHMPKYSEAQVQSCLQQRHRHRPRQTRKSKYINHT